MRLQRGCCLRGHRVLLLLNPGEPAFSFSVNRGPTVSPSNPREGEGIQKVFQWTHAHMSVSFPLAPLERP
jgi:hypothetical protein